ncbi:MAG: hypothetical protein ACUVS3_08505 [Thermodesulfobacteriota bacterium]
MREKTERRSVEELDFEALERLAREEELVRPRVEIWPDPAYDEWALWVRSHEMRKKGNPFDICELLPGMAASPLCPLGLH